MTGCQWPVGCPDHAGSSGFCRPHYMQVYRARAIAVRRWVDPGPLRQRMDEWTTRGRRLSTLAELAGVNHRALMDIAAGRVHRARPGVTETVLTIPLPPSDVGCVRRIRALTVRGYTLRRIAGEAGRGVTEVGLAKALYRQTFADPVAYTIAKVYPRLAPRWGPSRMVAIKALQYGWPPPSAWENRDVDKPQSRPDIDATRQGPEPLTLATAWPRAQAIQALGSTWPAARGLRALEAV